MNKGEVDPLPRKWFFDEPWADPPWDDPFSIVLILPR
jgi:hypothetical protein